MNRTPLTTVIASAWRDAARVRLWLPLYAISLVLALVQLWPLYDMRALHNPYLGDLASGGADTLMMAIISGGRASSLTANWYLLITLMLAIAYGLPYNFMSGGVLSVWAGERSLARGGARYFLTFLMLGLLLMLLGSIGVGAAAVLAAAGARGINIGLPVWLQLVNVFGEVARALAVNRQRRNPFAVTGQGIAFVARNIVPVVLFAVLGLALQAALLAVLVFANPALTSISPWLALIVQQAVIFGLLWVKMLRLALASQLVRAA